MKLSAGERSNCPGTSDEELRQDIHEEHSRVVFRSSRSPRLFTDSRRAERTMRTSCPSGLPGGRDDPRRPSTVVVHRHKLDRFHSGNVIDRVPQTGPNAPL